MRIVVSGTHASGKSTLIGDLVARHGHLDVLPDPYELLDDAADPPDVDTFLDQLWLAAERLVALPAGADVIAERGPLDLLAYLDAWDRLGRGSLPHSVRSHAVQATVEAMGHVDLLVVLPLTAGEAVEVAEEEDPALRAAMDAVLLDLIDDPGMTGSAEVVEVTGPPSARVAEVARAAGLTA